MSASASTSAPKLPKPPAKQTGAMQRLLPMAAVRKATVRQGATENLKLGVNYEAWLGQRVGDVEAEGCTRCVAGNGPWVECVTVEDEFLGSCANCHYGINGKKCSLRDDDGTSAKPAAKKAAAAPKSAPAPATNGKGKGKSPAKGKGKAPAKGKGKPPAKGKGKAPAKGKGKPPAKGKGKGKEKSVTGAGVSKTRERDSYEIDLDNLQWKSGKGRLFAAVSIHLGQLTQLFYYLADHFEADTVEEEEDE